ncbi:MFS transporter [Actinoplanes sp. KI2]|uniref:MFS transporter n=1 Tax=Actinoplanes sp. KI2 TaxID=2983315 RepID=UPI0021D59AD0|nr:MFS transporter [Actinoplanes sp. KI2]MCU7723929.1 MFS transporter [Actinoplanes sp. KI2]
MSRDTVEPESPPRPATSLLRDSRPFARLWAAHSISVVGDALRVITVALWAYTASGNSTRAVAIVMLAGQVPVIALGPFLGTIADRFSRRPIMVSADLARAALSLLTAFGMAAGSLPVVLGAVTLSAGFSVAFSAARSAAIPLAVTPAHLARANSLMTTTEQVSYVIGPLAGAALFSTVGFAPAMLIDAVSYLASALLLRTLPAYRPEAGSRAGERTPMLAEIRTGMRALRASRALVIASVTYLCLAVQAGANNTVMIGFLPVNLHRPPSEVAWLSLANGLAQILTASMFIALAARLRTAATLSVAAVVMAVGGWVLAMSTGLAVALCAVTVVALANSPFTIAFATLRQTAVPNAVQGRVSATLTSLSGIAFLTGAQAAGWLADLRDPRWSLIAAAAVFTVGTVVGLCGLGRRDFRAAQPP